MTNPNSATSALSNLLIFRFSFFSLKKPCLNSLCKANRILNHKNYESSCTHTAAKHDEKHSAICNHVYVTGTYNGSRKVLDSIPRCRADSQGFI